MIKKIVISVLGLCFMSACGTTSNICGVPEAQNSVICQVSKKINVSPENLSKVLLIANVAMLESESKDPNKTVAKEAYSFVTKAKAKLESIVGDLTYGDVVNYLLNTYKILPARVQAIFVVIDPLQDVVNQNIYFNKVLSSYDIQLLIRHLNKQEIIIKAYM